MEKEDKGKTKSKKKRKKCFTSEEINGFVSWFDSPF